VDLVDPPPVNDRPSKRPCYRVHYSSELDDNGSSSLIGDGE